MDETYTKTLALCSVDNIKGCNAQISACYKVLFDTLNTEEQYLYITIKELLTKAEEHFKQDFPIIPFTLDVKGTVGGYYVNDKKPYLRFNHECWLNNQSAYDNTIIHEIAHYIQYKTKPHDKPHSAWFYHIMTLLGGKPSRCHDYKVTPVRRIKTYTVYCGCRKHEITKIRFDRLMQGTNYICKYCNQPLKRLTY